MRHTNIVANQLCYSRSFQMLVAALCRTGWKSEVSESGSAFVYDLNEFTKDPENSFSGAITEFFSRPFGIQTL
jgi:hypothetical protein